MCTCEKQAQTASLSFTMVRKRIWEQGLAHFFLLAMLLASWTDVQSYMRGPHSNNWLHIQAAGIWGVNLLDLYETAMTYSSRVNSGL